MKNVDAANVAQTLRLVLKLLTLIGDDRDVHAVAVEPGNMILIQASEEKAQEVRTLLNWLDVNPK